MRLGSFECALEDCTLAATLHPSNIKAHFRMALALEQLGQHAAGLAAAQMAHDLLAAADDAQQHAAALISRLSGGAQACMQQGSRAAHDELPVVSTLPRLEVKHIPEEGRALQLGSDEGPVHRGGLLLSEDPVALVPSRAEQRARCHHCLRPLRKHGGIPCAACPLAWYCCAAHRSADRWHRPGGAACGGPWSRVLPEHVVLAVQLAAACLAGGDDAEGLRSLNAHVHAVPAEQLLEEALLSCMAARCAQLPAHLVLKALRQAGALIASTLLEQVLSMHLAGALSARAPPCRCMSTPSLWCRRGTLDRVTVSAMAYTRAQR